jgi:hypothetical protein
MGRAIEGITVIDVCRALQVEPDPPLTWSVGNLVRGMWERQYGALPEKDLRRKTAGGGSHCFAIYPYTWRDAIARVIMLHTTERQRQGELF